MSKLIYFQLLLLLIACSSTQEIKPLYLTKVFDLNKENLALFYTDQPKRPLGSFQALKVKLKAEKKELTFAMNAGMFHPNHKPVGLYIEEGKERYPLNRAQGNGNFYMQPNGVFYWTVDNVAKISNTTDFEQTSKIQYATQSGPMLLIDGEINSNFGEKSSNKHIRNGVGILADGGILFVISTRKVNLYDFATVFKEKGCENALYLDGFVSKIYAPALGETRLGGNFGVMIGSWK